MSTADPVIWSVTPNTAKLFAALLEQAHAESRELAELIDRVRSLPNFPLEWRPGQPIRIIITPAPSRPVIQVPRGSVHPPHPLHKEPR